MAEVNDTWHTHSNPSEEMDELSGQPSGDPGNDVKESVKVSGAVLASLFSFARKLKWWR